MAFRLGTVDDHPVLIEADAVYDIAVCSNGDLDAPADELMGRTGELDRLAATLADHEPTAALADVTLGPPIPRPRQVFGVGLNYSLHAGETGMALPEAPLVFTKFPSCLNRDGGEIPIASTTTDYEAELVVVIGGPVDAATAITDGWSAVGGLMVGQDISDRGLQNAGDRPQFALGKSHHGYGPIGPWVTSADLVPHDRGLSIGCTVNGHQRQLDTTDHLIFDIPTLVSYLAGIVTLYPGDLIFTGTPGGVGWPTGDYLRPGDEIVTTIELLGSITNRCV